MIASASNDGTILLWEITLTPSNTENIAEDVNADGVVNIQDLVLVSSNLGKTGVNKADVNADGIVDVRDLVQVATAVGQ